MNRVISIGNMTDDPRITYLPGEESQAKAEFTLALNRIKEGADFPRYIAWGKRAELIEKYCYKGMKVAVDGHIHTGSYTNKDGQKVYTTDVVVDDIEFLSRKDERPQEMKGQPTDNSEFMAVPDGIDDEIPFS